MPTKTPALLLPLLALAGACAASPPPAPTTARTTTAAEAAPAASGRRSPDAVLADAVAATGGAAAWIAHQTVHVKMTVTLAGMAMGGPADHYQTRDDKAVTVSTFPGVGLMREGSNGKIFWKQDPFNGARVLEGAEAEQARIEDAWNLEMEARAIFADIQTADSPPGLECLTLTPKAGPPFLVCYDRRTHLQVSLEGTSASPQGDVPFRTTVSDWRSLGGVKMPYLSETHAGPATIVSTINDVTFDVPVDDKMFELPAPGASAP